ncbi:hypothetical protein XENTR_v10009209 [Xenopus tropicalis]|uniref:tRNA-uridine aminocarboxypropyltransferase 1 n=1 Tax=Xenopus tropicalis TaxID=8364 RepID=A0A8J0SIL6_XENTR|nr:DTW domain-containing protein 1 isoform X2 [Xenopus tropicalis]KAE8617837.1 hypothetical protein XENTR_v10009209 [Xenopus tropicalis]|eukprot:XP_012814549.1 PREDICTED: DTW domain-containing protein 1 isoform X2 [Xenopus tropicalis]
MSHEKSESCLQEKKHSSSFERFHDGTSLENNLLQNLKLSSQRVLEIAQKKGRSKCPKCNSSRMFYCYTCFVPVESVPSDEIPVVKLPLKIDIIKHPNETDGKSTAVHAKLLAHEDVTVYTYPCVPQYQDQKHEVVLVFPGPDSVSLSDSLLYIRGSGDMQNDSSCEPSLKRPKCSQQYDKSKNEGVEEKKPMHFLKKLIFIDSTWNQTNKIISDERLQDVPDSRDLKKTMLHKRTFS